MSIVLRLATRADIPALGALIARSARGLSTDDYRAAQVEGALRGAFGIDTQLLIDNTYFLAEEDGTAVGCGGWSYRSTLFGGDARAGRDASVLDPRTQAAKIRAFFVEPTKARRGIGTLLLERCEQEARARGFTRVELMATLPGVKLYVARGYVGKESVRYDLGDGESIDFIPMSKELKQSIPVTLISGDGIGPEIMEAALAALDALGAPFQWDKQIAGLEGVKADGDPLPPRTIASIRRTRLALKGPLETPSGGGYRSSNVRLREEFKLYANLRPARTLIPGGRFDNIDLVVVRENLEGLYLGHEHYIQIDDDPHAVAMATGVNTRQGSRRLLEFAFDHAVAAGRKKVTIVHKANIMKVLTGIFSRPVRNCTNASTRGASTWRPSSSTPAP
jgi:GNAT superfamily N-acetyltransferase